MTPVLEIGGTHVTGALVDLAGGGVVAATRLELDAAAPADELIARFRAAAATVDAPESAAWGIAMPDPFDYERGVGLFEGVGKFAALNGVDVRSALGLRAVFLNDADAFVLGERSAGAAAGSARTVGVTLGTGVGTGWLVDGAVVDPGDPPGGRLHRVRIDGQPLEDVVSRRAIRAAYARATGDTAADVKEIATRARDGDRASQDVLDRAFGALGAALGPRVAGFGADLVVFGGSMARSWDVFGPAVQTGAGSLPEVRIAHDSTSAPLLGAAVHARRVATDTDGV